MATDKDGGNPATQEYLEVLNKQTINAWREKTINLKENLVREESLAKGTYGKRQIYELVQNGVDAATSAGLPERSGRIKVLLTDDALYVANTGQVLSRAGLIAILNADLSPKDQSGQIGRFGLGFKSVLGVSDSPKIFSGEFACEFNFEWNRSQIQDLLDQIKEKGAPLLRLARPMDKGAAVRSDAFLKKLLTEFDTVIKLPLRSGSFPWLEKDIKEFPAPFLLFCPSVESISLEIRSSSSSVYQTVISEAKVKIPGARGIRNGTKVIPWKTFSKTLTPSEAAIEDGGRSSGRSSIQVTWAVPFGSGSLTPNNFWAYFPIDAEELSLKGILNASWKLSEDRHHIKEDSLLNSELVAISAELVLENIHELLNSKDPGELLDAFPGRLNERKRTDELFTRELYIKSAGFEVVPNWKTKLRSASEVKVPEYSDSLPEVALEWAQGYGMDEGWIHPTCLATVARKARLESLRNASAERIVRGARRAANTDCPLKEWLEALTVDAKWEDETLSQDESVWNSGIAIKILADLLSKSLGESNQDIQNQLREARVIYTADGRFVSLGKSNSNVFLPSGESHKSNSKINIVHPELCQDKEVLAALKAIGVAEMDATSEFVFLLDEKGFDSFGTREWIRFWEIVEKIETSPDTIGMSVPMILKSCGDNSPADVIKVETVSGRYEFISNVIVWGGVIESEADADAFPSVALSSHFEKHARVILDLGGKKNPEKNGGSRKEIWFDEYEREAYKTFVANQKATTNPQENRLQIGESKSFFGPIAPLSKLTGKVAARFTSHLMESEEVLGDWVLSHPTMRGGEKAYADVAFESPVLWMLKKHGIFETSLGPKSLSRVLGSSFSEHSAYLPVISSTDLEREEKLGLPQSVEEVPNKLLKALLDNSQDFNDAVKLGSLYFFLASSGKLSVPSTIRARHREYFGNFSPDEVAVVVAQSTQDEIVIAIESAGPPFVIVQSEEKADILRAAWGLKPSESFIRKEIKANRIGVPESLIDRFPAIALHSSPRVASIEMVSCSEIWEEVSSVSGVTKRPLRFAMVGDEFLYLSTLEDREVLQFLSDLLGLALTEEETESLVEGRRNEEYVKRLREVKEELTLEQKLLMLVGVEGLKRWLKQSQLIAVGLHGPTADELEVARFFLAIYGVSSLERLKEQLKENGFIVPSQWVGGYQTRKFVTDLGFPIEFAGFENANRSEHFDVPGPAGLPPLHEFQRSAAENLKKFFKIQEKKRRGVLSLPTGSGKTRVAVQSICESLRQGIISGPILWVAQSDELCEQAVQAWEEVWRSEGSAHVLRVNRLWSTNNADRYFEGQQIVIATIQKLEKILKNISNSDGTDYLWLRECPLLVIDEAHLSLAESYTRLINWLNDVQEGKSSASAEDRVHLLGLTATPFRTNERESQWLTSRYNGVRFDKGIFGDEDPYAFLQEREFLSKVQHLLLEGTDIDFTSEERDEWNRTKKLPLSVLRRIGEDRDRNEKVLDAIRGLPENASVLVFAPSVENAELLAARLVLEGITAKPVSADTKPGVRRHYIEEFRKKRIKVLTNYGVLTTGFDAPSTNAIVVARPTFSPSLYQQMIGRGLRGPKNNGSAVCTIVNVADNFVAFGEELAFKEFEYLWEKE